MARPCRCAASLQSEVEFCPHTELPGLWLGHADARQVSDLPATALQTLAVSDRQRIQAVAVELAGSETLRLGARRPRQVIDLPRISMAEPFRTEPLSCSTCLIALKTVLPRISMAEPFEKALGFPTQHSYLKHRPPELFRAHATIL
jgi:hypothetical protein